MTIPSILLRAAAVRRFLGSTRLLAAVAVILGALLAAQSVRWLCVGRRERAVLKSLAFKNDKAPERVKTRPVEEFEPDDHGNRHARPGAANAVSRALWEARRSSAPRLTTRRR